MKRMWMLIGSLVRKALGLRFLSSYRAIPTYTHGSKTKIAQTYKGVWSTIAIHGLCELEESPSHGQGTCPCS